VLIDPTSGRFLAAAMNASRFFCKKGTSAPLRSWIHMEKPPEFPRPGMAGGGKPKANASLIRPKNCRFQAGDHRLVGVLRAAAFRPVLQRHEVEGAVGCRAEAEQREADDRIVRPHLGSGGEDGVDLRQTASVRSSEEASGAGR